MYKILTMALLTSVLFGCSITPLEVRVAERTNKELHESRSPVRVNVVVLGGGFTAASQIWAGKKGESVIQSSEEILKNDIINSFKECGFDASSVKEVRVVEHKHPFYYEVWVFSDAQSEREDKMTGISLILTSPKTGGTDINIRGNCPAK